MLSRRDLIKTGFAGLFADFSAMSSFGKSISPKETTSDYYKLIFQRKQNFFEKFMASLEFSSFTNQHYLNYLPKSCTYQDKLEYAYLFGSQLFYNFSEGHKVEHFDWKLVMETVGRMISNLTIHNFVNVMAHGAGLDHENVGGKKTRHCPYFKNQKMIGSLEHSKSRLLTSFAYDTSYLKMVNGLDPKLEVCMVLGQELAMQRNRKVIHSIKQQVNKFSTFAEAKTYIESSGNKIGWVVMPYEIIREEFNIDVGPEFYLNVFPANNDDEVQFFIDPLMKANEMVLGTKPDENDPAYIESVYIPLTLETVKMATDTGPEFFSPRHSCFSYDASKMLRPECFASVELNRFI